MDHFERYLDNLPAAAAIRVTECDNEKRSVIVVCGDESDKGELRPLSSKTYGSPEQARTALTEAGLFEVTEEELIKYGENAAKERVKLYKRLNDAAPAVVVVEKSGHRFIKEGRQYSPAEFSHLIEKAEDEWKQGKESGNSVYLGYARINYSINNVPFDAEHTGELKCRQAIGDGDRTLAKHVSSVADDNIEMLREWGTSAKDREALKEARKRRCWIVSFIEFIVDMEEIENELDLDTSELSEYDEAEEEARRKNSIIESSFGSVKYSSLRNVKHFMVTAAEANIISLLLESEKIGYHTAVSQGLGVVAVSRENYTRIVQLIKTHNVRTKGQHEKGNELSERESAEKYLNDRIKDILKNDGMESFCKQPSLYSLRNYSFANAVLIKSQLPEASVCRSERAWQIYGRSGRPDCKPIKIFQPLVLGENNITAFWGKLKKEIADSYSAEKNFGEARIPDTDVTITGNNDSYDIRIKGKILVANQPSKVIKNWMTKVMLNKVTIDHVMGNVYDISQTDTAKDELWLRSGYKLCDMIHGDNGLPLKDGFGYYRVKNTPERTESFVSDGYTVLKRRDKAKLKTFYEVLRAVCEKMGHPVSEISSDEAAAHKKEGFYSPKDDMIMICCDEDIYDKVSIVIHELAFAEVHGTGGQKNTSAYETDIQSEAAACIVASRFGIDTDIGSFRSCPQMVKIRSVEVISGYLENMWGISRRISSQIESELNERGLTVSLEPYSEENSKMLAPQEVQSLIKGFSETLADVKTNNINHTQRTKREYENCVINNIKLLLDELIKKQSTINDESMSLTAMILGLSTCETAFQQRDLINRIKTGFSRIAMMEDECVKIRNAIEMIPQPQTPLQQFRAAPMNFMDKTPEFKDVSYDLKVIIALSKFIRQKYAPLLERSVKKFAETAVRHAENIQSVMSKNGTAVEINDFEYKGTHTKMIPGTVMHPRYADDLFKRMECEIQSEKKAAERRGDYFPSLVSDFTIYSNINTFNVKGTAAMSGILFVGDGRQNSLSEYISEIRKGIERTEVCENFFDSLKEKGKSVQYILPDNGNEAPKKDLAKDNSRDSAGN